MNRTTAANSHLRLVTYTENVESAVFPLSAPPQWSSRRLRQAARNENSMVKPLVLLTVAVVGISALIAVSRL